MEGCEVEVEVALDQNPRQGVVRLVEARANTRSGKSQQAPLMCLVCSLCLRRS